MSGSLTLYRGDYTKISEFDFHKTSKYCLVGPGIYLTNKLAVAQSYRAKGSWGQAKIPKQTLFEGLANDRMDALAKAVPEFIQTHYADELRQAYQTKGNSGRKVLAEKLAAPALAKLKELYLEGHVKVDYLTKFFFNRPTARTLVVTYDDPAGKYDGYVTEFSFDAKLIQDQVVKIDGHIGDPLFWEILWDSGIQFGRQFVERSSYIMYNVETRSPVPVTRPLEPQVLQRIRRATQPYGYLGFEHKGGVYVGGLGTHRAFCIWDDDFVNRHKVRRFR